MFAIDDRNCIDIVGEVQVNILVEERLKLLLENKKLMEEEILKHKTVEREN